MASKRVRLRYWSVDLRQFAFWFAVAFVAGAGPNLAQLLHPLALLGVSVAAAGVAGVLWYRDRRKKGIGVYIHFGRPGPGPSQEAILSSVRTWMEKHHRDWFRAGPDRLDEKTEQRVDIMLASIRHRLDEVESWAGGTPSLFLYVQCGLREAFALAQRMAPIWGFHNPARISQDLDAWTLVPVDVHIRTMSGHSPKRPYHLDLAKALTVPCADRSLVAATSKILTTHDPNGSASGQPYRLAVLVYAAPDNPAQQGREAFIREALAAAAGSIESGYDVGPDDICGRSLTLSMSVSLLVEALDDINGVEAAIFVAAIREHWEEYAQSSYGTTDVPVRLFMQAPSILAFALAALFPVNSRLVRRVQSIMSGGTMSTPDIVAIVDGDDVGDGMEWQLLARDLDGAIEYSKRTQAAMTRLTALAVAIPGVELLSVGGDSAIFTLPRTVLGPFVQFLTAARSDLGFRFSCGYGENTRDAFVALRSAKTSGKNITMGSA